MPNAEVIHYRRQGYDIDRAQELQSTLRKLTSRLLVEGTLEDARHRQAFHSKRQREKLKRGRKTGPKHFNKGAHRFTLKEEAK